jgi:KipI family sensor histidine kinase inhibitor
MAERAAALAAAVGRASLAGVIDVVPSIDRVTVVYDLFRIGSHERLLAELSGVADALPASGAASAGRKHEIPVCYDAEHGPDLDEVCSQHGIGRARFIDLHTAPEYTVQAIGFVPGFPYLGGLPAELATPRRDTPRPVVPAGAVGIGAGQTGIYPCATPGGWHIVGRTGAVLFDAAREPAALLRAGDRVRFVATTAAELAAALARPPARSAPSAVNAAIEIVRPGLATSIQDLGRPGFRAMGVPLCGAADTMAMRLANLIVGNPESAAGIECTLLGPDLRFECDAVVALGGAEFAGLPSYRPVRVAAGTVLSLGHARSGCRGYLAIAGGVTVPQQMGSRSTYAPARLGGTTGAALAAGDRVPIRFGAATIRGAWSLAADLNAPAPSPCVLRVLSGGRAEKGDPATWATTWRVSSRSNRMGIRLEGQPLPGGRADMVSAAVLPGTIQLPPDGRPIILLADAQTIGGYPVVGQVIAADLPRAAQLRPGDVVRWRLVDLDEAHAAYREQAAWLAAVRESLAGRVTWSE